MCVIKSVVYLMSSVIHPAGEQALQVTTILVSIVHKQRPGGVSHLGFYTQAQVFN